ncbi:TIGR03084 family protein [Gordonia sp. TBRC 11910]|uniref:TIGR03084 family protein n=1 Tax=Gordonia asplenii TaxID=2725283 RepID=A0A848KV61_9ACTN|nr:TIGR03084 family metal-binding protein [Gordonia asplenii]NMO02149.1 TIGR03084 family protein [Gordonia asplenii]
MAVVDSLVLDLAAESDALDDVVANLDAAAWATPTPAPGWTIAHQIGHLLWTDTVSLLAITDADGFAKLLETAMQNPGGFVDDAAEEQARRPPAEMLADWRATRSKLGGALIAVPQGRKLPWFGPPMSAASMASARMMETWAHSLDVFDALGMTRTEGDRIKAVVNIGVRTRDFSYLVNGKTAPAQPFRYEIIAPSGELWTWGPDDASDIVRGPAVDFAELVTQRRNVADLDLELIGDDAAEWSTIAQAFAGAPGVGREPKGR